mgnify:CR=1 FL=1
MPLRHGSIGWSIAKQTATHLEILTSGFESAVRSHDPTPISDEEFTFMIACAIDYGGVNPAAKKLPKGITLGNVLLEWRHGTTLPSEQTRKTLMRWIIRELRGQITEIKAVTG